MYKPSKPSKPTKPSKPSKMLKQPTYNAFKIQDKTPVKAQSYLKQSYNKTSVDVRNMLFELPEDIIALIYYFKHRDLMMNLFVGKNYNFALGVACTKIRYGMQVECNGGYIGLRLCKGYDSPRKNIKPFDLNYMEPSCKCKGKNQKNKPCGVTVKYGVFCRFHKNKKTLFDF